MAETPPPFPNPPTYGQNGPAAKKSSPNACLLVIGLVAGLCVVGGVLMFFLVRGVWGDLSAGFSCQATFEASHKALLAYALEHDGRLPSASSWQTDTEPYYRRLVAKLAQGDLPKDMKPAAPGSPFSCAGQRTPTSIAFNIALSGAKLSEVKDPEKTALLFETPTPAQLNLAEAYVERPKSEAPKFMSSERDWIVYFVEGMQNPFDSGAGPTPFSLNPEDGLPEPPDPPLPSEPAAEKVSE